MADESIKRLIELGVNATPAIEELKRLNRGMEENTQSIDALSQGLGQFAKSAVDVFQQLAIMDIAKQFVDGVKQMIDEMDQLGKSAQATGLSVEKLQEIQFALKLGAGLESGEATAALTRFNDKLADIGSKTSNASRLLREMGVTANDTVASAMEKVADKFSNASDGINKSAISTELFGRALGEKMIPFLNGGSKGIQDLNAELKKLGGTFTGDVTKQAGDFNDNLTKIQQAAKDGGIAIVSGLLPYLRDLSGALVQGIEKGTLWADMWKRFKDNWADNETYLKRALTGQNWGPTNLELREQQTRLDDYKNKMQGYADQVARMKSVDPLPQANVVTDKIKKTGSAAAQAKSDFESWMDAMLKAGQADKDLNSKIQWLEQHLAALAKAGDISGEAFKKWNAELLKLRPDAVASELLKIADAAKKMDEATSDKMLKGLTDAMENLMQYGPPAGAAVGLLHAQILKIKADQGDVQAGVDLELEKSAKLAQADAAAWEEYERRFAQGLITQEQYSEGLSRHITKLSQQVSTTKDDVFDLGKAISDAGAKFVTDFVDDMIDGIGEVHKSFSDMVTDMLKQLAKLIIQQQIAASFKTIQSNGGFSSLFAAQGAAFSTPNVQYMATGGILNSPTFFAHGGRLAVAGEAGPEAVVPLQRSASGNLGVAASPVTVNVNNSTPAEVHTETKDNADGSRQIDIYITQKVKAMMSDGSLDRTMRGSYGLTRQPAGR